MTLRSLAWTILMLALAGRAAVGQDDAMALYRGPDPEAVLKDVEAAEQVELTRRHCDSWNKVVVEPSKKPGTLTGLEEAWPLGFSRADVDAAIHIPIKQTKVHMVRVAGVLQPGDHAFDTRLPIKDGEVVMPFPAAVLAPGDYTLKLVVSDGHFMESAELPITVGPFIHYDNLHAFYWNSGGGGLEALKARVEMCKRLKLTMLDSPMLPAREALKAGLVYSYHEVTLHQGQVKKYAGADEYVQLARTKVPKLGYIIRRMNHVRYCLTNSEYGSARRPTDHPEYDQAMRAELGFAPHAVAGGKDLVAKQVAPGVYPDDLKEIRAGWFQRREGQGWFRLNRLTASIVRKYKPEIVTWTEPLQAPEQFSEIDAISFWSYSPVPERLLMGIKTAESYRRTIKAKYIFSITSQMSMGVKTERTGKGASNVLRSPDQQRMFTWLQVAQGVENIGFWALGMLPENPEAADGVAAAMTEVAYPVGTLLKRTEPGRVPVAVYLSTTGTWLGRADRPHNQWFQHHYRNSVMPGLMKRFRNQLIILDDDDILDGRAEQYPVLVCPALRATTESLRAKLRQYQQKGGVIAGDDYWRIDGLQPDDHFGGKRPKAYDLQYRNAHIYQWGQKNTAAIMAWTPKGLPNIEDRFPLWCDSPEVTLSHRISGTRHLVTVVNRRMKKGAFSEKFKVTDPRYLDEGMPQTVTLKLSPEIVGKSVNRLALDVAQVPHDLDLKRVGDRVEVTLPLRGSDGEVLVLDKVAPVAPRVDVPARVGPGTIVPVAVQVVDVAGNPVKARTVIRLTVTDAAGKLHDASGLFPLEAGGGTVRFGVAADAVAGKVVVTALDLASGLSTTREIMVTK